MKITTAAQSATIVILSLVLLCEAIVGAREPGQTSTTQRKPPYNGSMFGKRSVLAPLDAQQQQEEQQQQQQQQNQGATTDSYMLAAELPPDRPARALTDVLVERCVAQLRDQIRK